MIERIKDYINIIFNDDFDSINTTGHISKSVVSVVLFVSSILMLALNIIAHQTFLINCSIILVIGFAMSFIIAYFFKNDIISTIIIALLVGFVLTLLAFSGGNEGFAILWVVLVPIFAISVVGIPLGVFVSTYFLILLFVLFYSPLNGYVIDKYTHNFIMRFPVLYSAEYILAIYLSLQKEYYYKKALLKSYTDELTGAYNRRYFVEKINKLKDNYGILSIDINGLKRTNDILGHTAGDELIKAVYISLRKAFDSNCDICRIGGDEFVVFVGDNRDIIEKNIKVAKALAFGYKGKFITQASFSAGYALSSYASDGMAVYAIADSNMYMDKKNYYTTDTLDRRNK